MPRTEQSLRPGSPGPGWVSSTTLLPGGDLALGHFGLGHLALAYGTPLQVVDLEEFAQRCAMYGAAFDLGEPPAPTLEVAYAAPALFSRAIARIVRDAGLSLTVTTEAELAVAAAAGFPAERVLLQAANFSEPLIGRARAYGVGRVVIDSIDDLDAAARLATPGQPQRVLLRVTADFAEAYGHPIHLHDQKYGVTLAGGLVDQAVQRIIDNPHLELVGLHCHLGHHVTAPERYERAVTRLMHVRTAIADRYGHVLSELNLGGGHPVVADTVAAAVSTARLSAALHDAASAGADPRLPFPRLVVEPGAAIAGASGVVVFRVLAVKRTPSRTWASVDGRITTDDVIANTTGTLATRVISRRPGQPHQPITLVSCHEDSDHELLEDVSLPADIRAGDLLALSGTAAHRTTCGPDAGSGTQPALVAVEHGISRLIVRRESVDDALLRDLG